MAASRRLAAIHSTTRTRGDAHEPFLSIAPRGQRVRIRFSLPRPARRVLLAFGGLAPVQADDGLVVVGYGGAGQKAQEVAFFQPFTQQTGIPVVQSEYNGEMAGSR